MQLNHHHRAIRFQYLKTQTSGGFTLLEMMVLLATIGILFAIALPVGMPSLNRLRLSTAQDEVFQAIRTAQSKAKLNRVNWQASFRDNQGIVQWVVHPVGITPDDSLWDNLDANVQLDETETTLQNTKGVRQVQFNHLGRVNGQLGRLTLKAKAGGQTRRCVYVSSLLGALRKGEDHPKKYDGKTCY